MTEIKRISLQELLPEYYINGKLVLPEPEYGGGYEISDEMVKRIKEILKLEEDNGSDRDR